MPTNASLSSVLAALVAAQEANLKLTQELGAYVQKQQDMQQSPVERFISTKKAAELVHLSQSSVCRLCYVGRLKAKKSGKKWLVDDRLILYGTPNHFEAGPGEESVSW